MVCTDLQVTAPQPVVGVVVNSTGFSQAGVFLNGDCSVLVTDIIGIGKYLEAGVTIRVSTAKAKYDLKFNYTLDGVAKTFTAVGITQDINDTVQFVSTTISYVVGSYAGLTASVLNVTAA